MGRIVRDTTISHFSHPHPLHLSSPDQHQSSLTPISCAACTLPSTTWTYSCAPCSFHLHLPCSQLPPLIHHPFHPLHSLSLLPRPTYPEGYFNCDACARTGTAFSYHCSPCGVDLHTECAAMLLSVHHYAHTHPLTLAFFPPYDNKGFCCDVCGSLGGNHWLYRCALCEFDVHLGCGARAEPEAGTVISRGVSQRSAVGLRRPQMLPQQQQGLSQMGSTGELMRRVANGLVDGATQQIGMNLVNGLFAGGGGDDAGGGGGDGGGSSIMNMGSTIIGSVLGGVSGRSPREISNSFMLSNGE